MSTPPKHTILSMVSYLQELKTIILEKSVFPVIAFFQNLRMSLRKRKVLKKMRMSLRKRMILTKRKKKSFILVRFPGKPIFVSSWSYWDV